MDSYICQVVAEGIKAGEIIIEGKRQSCNWSGNVIISYRANFTCIFYVLPRQLFEMGVCVFDNVWVVVEMKGRFQGVGIADGNYQSKQKTVDDFAVTCQH